MLPLAKYILPLLLLSASSVVGQTDPGTIVQILSQLGLTNLTNVATTVANTTAGKAVFALLLSGQPVTVFAPSNQAFAGVPSNITSNITLLSEIISYHVLPGTFNSSHFFNNSNTIGRTLLNSTDRVRLGPGNQSQAIAGRLQDGKIRILNQNTNVLVSNTSTQGNLTLHIVNAVIDVPGNLEAALTTHNLSLFRQAANRAGLLSTLDSSPGITLFIPSDEAFQKVASQASQVNETTLANVLLNHVVNGSVIYSPQLGNGTVTSGGGSTFRFITNSSGIYTQAAGNDSLFAKVTLGDVILQNGVAHIIDSVLLNTYNDAESAGNAYASNTAAAGASQTAPSGPIGTPQPGGTGGDGGSSSAAGAIGMKVSMTLILVLVGMMVGVAAL